jgi:hypothetical protein
MFRMLIKSRCHPARRAVMDSTGFRPISSRRLTDRCWRARSRLTLDDILCHQLGLPDDQLRRGFLGIRGVAILGQEAAHCAAHTPALQRLFSGHDAIVHSYAPPFDLKVRAQVNEYVAKLTSEGRSAMEAFASYWRSG